MDAGKENKPVGRVKLFLLDPTGRVVGREVTKTGDDADFLFVLNETGKREAIPKRLVVRYLEVA